MASHKPLPDDINPETIAANLAKPGTGWHRYHCKLVTPMYGGGVEAGIVDEKMPIRATAIRGQLRFWWRIINLNKFIENGKVSHTKLFEAERAIWGGLGNADELAASKLNLWISDLSINGYPKPCANYSQKTDKTWSTTPKFPFGPSYVQFPGKGKCDKHNGVTENPKLILQPGAHFYLNVSMSLVSDQQAEELWGNSVLPALRWWASFGGLGARTRRGMGAVKVDGLSPVTEVEAMRYNCRLISRAANSDATQAWTQAIDKLRNFRQGVGVGRNPGTAPSPAGRSRWPEADSIREITCRHLDQPARPAQNGKPAQPAKAHIPTHPSRQSFPRAAFGLPIITHFKDEPRPNTSSASRSRFDPEETALYPVVKDIKLNDIKRDRLASPLILKPMWDGSDYAPIALLLPYDHVKKMGLQLENNSEAYNPDLPKTFSVNDWWPALAQSAMTEAVPAKSNPLQGKTGDVLADFLDFFDNGTASLNGTSPPIATVDTTPETRLEGARLKLNRVNESISIMKDGKETIALKDDATKLLASLSETLRKRLNNPNEYIKINVVIVGREIKSLEEIK